MSDSVEQLNLFKATDMKHEQDGTTKLQTSALPASASSQWQQLYKAISNYAKRLDDSLDNIK